MITCPRCNQPLPDWLLRDSHISSICPQCQSPLEVYAFPALYRTEETVDASELALGEGEACCYEHSSSRAAALCSNCGRFLCRLCEVQLGTQVFCPDCVQSHAGTSRQNELVTQRTKFDSIALALAVWPLLVFYFTIITAPLSLVMAIYAWKRPTSIVRHSRWRVFVAIGIASVELAGMTALIFTLVYAAKRRF